MPRTSTLVALSLVSALASLGASTPSVRSTGQFATTLERSTGQVEATMETQAVVESKPLAFAEAADRAVFEGTISRRGPVEVVLSPVPDGMLDVGVAAKSGPIWMSVFRDDATEPLAGTAPSGRATRWISSGDGARKLRVVAYCAGDETPFRVTVRVTKAAAAE